MRPAAQIQAVIELLDHQDETRQPADRLMANYFKQRRYIGSKDKRAIAERFYQVLRSKLGLEYLLQSVSLAVSGRHLIAANLLAEGQKISAIFDGNHYHPPHLKEATLKSLLGIDFAMLKDAPSHVQLNVPEWLEPSLIKALGQNYEGEMAALNERASTDIRVNTLKASRTEVVKEFEDAQLKFEQCELSPVGIRFQQRVALFNLPGFKQGHFEIQDEGSQLLALLTGAKVGDRVVDFCAGAGGKSLAMAAMMENKGTIYACDVHSKRLAELQKRTKRAGVHNVRIHLLSSEHDKWVKQHRQTADVVLIDAPCSGSGTWRRNPDSRWNLSRESLDTLIELQQSILSSAARLVKPGGKLFYATCSLFCEENEEQVKLFLSQNPEFTECEKTHGLADPEKRIEQRGGSVRTFPAKSATDGFYLCALQRTGPAEETLEATS